MGTPLNYERWVKDLALTQNDVRRWIAALDTGEFSQTTGRLCRTKAAKVRGEIVYPGHCCIGVFAETQVEEGKMKSANSAFAGEKDYFFADGPLSGDGNRDPYLAVDVMGHMIGWNKDGTGVSLSHKLWTMNDVQKKSFNEIAGFLRAKVLPKMPV